MTLTKDHVESRAEVILLPGQAFIDGQFCDATDGSTFETINPATGDRLCAVAHCKGGCRSGGGGGAAQFR